MTNAGPADAAINGDGFRFYRWVDPVTNEQTDVLSVTSIRRLAGESFILVNWQIANLIDVAMGTVKRTVIGPRGGVKEVHVKDEFPGEFIRRLTATNGEQKGLDEVRKWLRASADEPRNIAAARGTITHGAIEKNISDEAIDREYVEEAFGRLSKRDRDSMKDGVTDEDILFVQRCMTQYWDMRDKVPFVIIAREPQVWNLTAGYAGSADAIVWFLPEGVTPKDVPKANLVTQEDIERIGGYTAVGDWKTSKGVYTDHVIQATAYTAAEFVGSGGVIDQRLTDILSKTRHGVLFHIRPDEWNTHAFEFTEPTLRAFLGCTAFARFLALHPKPDALFTVTHSSKDDERQGSSCD